MLHILVLMLTLLCRRLAWSKAPDITGGPWEEGAESSYPPPVKGFSAIMCDALWMNTQIVCACQPGEARIHTPTVTLFLSRRLHRNMREDNMHMLSSGAAAE